MLNPTVTRCWTLATWLLTGLDDAGAHADPTVAALRALDADVIAVQSVRRPVAELLAGALAMRHEWALSHYPRTPLFRSQGVGLAVFTPHRIIEHRTVVVSTASSTWSNDRRIAQAVLIERPDHSSYAVVHAVPPVDAHAGFDGSAPTIVIRPVQVGIDPSRAIELPPTATAVATDTTVPIAGGQPLLVVRFEQDWVQPDFPPAT
jgi:hypothetical protein